MEPTKPTPEQAPRPATGSEQLAAPAEQAPAAPANTPAAAPTLPITVSTTDPAAAANQPAPTTVTPSMANDVDVLEKEWVDKAEAVIVKTAGDPHAEEAAVDDLQVDYLKKRYNKDIKKAEG